MGDEPDGKGVTLHLGHGEGNAIDRNAALRHEVTARAGRGPHTEIKILSPRLEALDHPLRIDVAGDKMPPDLAVETQAALEIDRCAGSQRLEVGQPPCLLEHVEAKMLLVGCDDGKTAAVDRDAVALGDVAARGVRGDLQAP